MLGAGTRKSRLLCTSNLVLVARQSSASEGSRFCVSLRKLWTGQQPSEPVIVGFDARSAGARTSTSRPPPMVSDGPLHVQPRTLPCCRKAVSLAWLVLPGFPRARVGELRAQKVPLMRRRRFCALLEQLPHRVLDPAICPGRSTSHTGSMGARRVAPGARLTLTCRGRGPAWR
jgi:hypothetical protein